MGNKTPLYQAHLDSGAKIVDFGGWDMPINYGSQLEEHHFVRSEAGMFDVSHMTIVDLSGAQAEDYLRYLLANDVAKLKTIGKALYTGMLNENGGVIDDLIVYRMQQGFRLVVNCATREKDLAWMQEKIEGFDAELLERPELAMVAVQGPKAIELSQQVASDAAALIADLKVFQGLERGEWMFCRTGYTGEDGLEIMVPAQEVSSFWKALEAAGVHPCGLGARDTLRLEAGMNLYGSDMDDDVSPLAANMGWTIAWSEDRDFIGKAALAAEKEAGPKFKQVGLVLEARGVLRAHQKVLVEHNGETLEGEITSGTFSPTLGYSVALARVPSVASESCDVEMRNKRVPVKIVKAPFVRNGERVYQ